MFTQFSNQSLNHNNFRQRLSIQKQYSPLDLQYEICAKFMKITSEKLYVQELDLISSTITQNVHANRYVKDISITQENITIDTILDDDDVFSQSSKSRLLLRKSHSGSCLRRTENSMTEALKEVQKRCSEQVASTFSNLILNFRKNQEKLACLQKMQSEGKKKQLRYQAAEQEIIILKKKILDLETNNKNYVEENLKFKKKIKEFNDQLKITTSPNSSNSSKVADGSSMNASHACKTQDLRKYIEQKQLRIFKKQKQIKQIQQSIEKSISKVLRVDESCEKCCLMVKKIKESIMKYRQYLEEESASADLLYDHYKKLFHL